jgi:hypothetical protein
VSVFFVGAMPWVQLFQDGERTGWASVVQADWSPQGTGRFVTLRRDGRWRVVGTNRALIDWLWDWYLRPAMEEAGEAWEREPFELGEVELAIDLDRGLTARGGGIEIELSEPIDRQLIRRERYPLGGFEPTASWVRVPCARARIVVDGEPIPGIPSRATDSAGPRSSAQINVAEVWTT